MALPRSRLMDGSPFITQGFGADLFAP